MVSLEILVLFDTCACLLISAVNVTLSNFSWVVWMENTDLMSFESEHILFKFCQRSVDGT